MNFQQEQDKIIENLTEMPELLLHSCCGPCSSYCIEVLSKYFNVTVFWYNPNIQPTDEYNLRRENQIKLIENMKTVNRVKFLEVPYDDNEFLEVVKGFELEPEGGKRCEQCFLLRMEKTAKLAKERGFDYFTTTLTVSPHKNAPLINDIGYKFAEKYHVKFLPSDFKKKNGYKRSIELSRMYELYRQDYCGCSFSQH